VSSRRPTLSVIGGTPFIDGRSLFRGSSADLLTEFDKLQQAGGVHLVMTLNVDQLVCLEGSAAFRAAFDQSSIRTIDGWPVLQLSRILGAADVERLAGADLLPLCVQAASHFGWRVVLAGGADGVAERAVQRFRGRFPAADVWAQELPWSADGDSAATSEDASVARLQAIKPDIVFVCLGAPKQELWVESRREYLPDAIYIGAGAALDFAAGVQRRAPRLLQRVGLEWVWRLMFSPRRLWRRYLLRGPRFALIAVSSYKNKRHEPPGPPASTRSPRRSDSVAPTDPRA
jgi:N-acetylglucosaminyldiphosphoundecaprenol N-acetyl-beta-D-mannosaminyltransferase